MEECYDSISEALNHAVEYSSNPIVYGMIRIVDTQQDKIVAIYGAGSKGQPSYLDVPGMAKIDDSPKPQPKQTESTDASVHICWPTSAGNWWCSHWEHPIEVRQQEDSIVVKARGELWSKDAFRVVFGEASFKKLTEKCPYVDKTATCR